MQKLASCPKKLRFETIPYLISLFYLGNGPHSLFKRETRPASAIGRFHFTIVEQKDIFYSF